MSVQNPTLGYDSMDTRYDLKQFPNTKRHGSSTQEIAANRDMVVSRISLGLAAAAIAAALQACSIVSAFTTTFIPVPTAKARRRVVESRAWAVKPNYYHVSCRSTSSNVRLLGMNAAAEPESGGEEPRSRRDVITGEVVVRGRVCRTASAAFAACVVVWWLTALVCDLTEAVRQSPRVASVIMK